MEKLARFTNILSRLKLVSSEHPYLDSSILKGLNGVRHVVLEPILDCSASDQCDSSLEVAIHFLDEFLPVGKVKLCLCEITQEFVQLLLTHDFHAHE
jgi:hypothetical protein